MGMKIGIIGGLKHRLDAWSNKERELALEELMDKIKMEDQLAKLASNVESIEVFPDLRKDI